MPTTRQDALADESVGRADGAGAGLVLLMGLAGVVVAGLCAVGVYLASPRGAPQSIVMIGATTVPQGEARLLVQRRGRAWLVNTGSGFRALEDRCTRCGGRLRWDDAQSHFKCAGDGTVYGIDGLVVQGLTRAPLSEVPTRVEGRWIAIRGG